MSQAQPHGKLPSTAELERFVKEKEALIFWTLDGKEHKGTLRWFDEVAFALVVSLDDKQAKKHVTLQRHAVIGYGPIKTPI
jgi:hypothetical protein